MRKVTALSIAPGRRVELTGFLHCMSAQPLQDMRARELTIMSSARWDPADVAF